MVGWQHRGASMWTNYYCDMKSPFGVTFVHEHGLTFVWFELCLENQYEGNFAKEVQFELCIFYVDANFAA